MPRTRRILVLTALLALVAPAFLLDAADARDLREPPSVVDEGGLGVHLELVTTFQPLFGGGYSLAYSADGTRMATGGVIGDIVIWDAETLEPLRRWQPAGGPLEEIHFSPNGKRLVAGQPVVVWDVETGEALKRFRGGGGAAWDPKGRWLAHGGEGTAVVLRDAATYGIAKVVPLEAGAEFITWSRDGSRLAVGTTRGHVVEIDPTKGEVLSTRLLDESEPIYAVGFLPDGSLVAASRDGRILLGDREIPAVENGKSRLSDGISRLAISPDGTRIAFGYYGTGTVEIRDAKTFEVVEEHERLTDGRWVGGLSWSPDGKTLCALPDGGGLRAVRDGEVTTHAGNATEVRSVSFDASGRWAAASGTGLAIVDLEAGTRNDLPGFSVVSEGRRPGELLASGSEVAAFVDAHVGDELDRFETPEANAVALRGPWTSPDGRDAVMGGFYGTFHVSLERAEVREIENSYYRVIDAAWAADSRWGAVAQVAGHHGESKAIGVFRRQDDGLVLRTTRIDDTAYAIAIDPTGEHLVAGGYHGLVSYDPETLEETGRHDQAVLWFRFLTSGLGIAGAGKNVMAIDVATGESKTLLEGDDLRHAAISRDGKRLIVGSRFAVWVYDIVR